MTGSPCARQTASSRSIAGASAMHSDRSLPKQRSRGLRPTTRRFVSSSKNRSRSRWKHSPSHPRTCLSSCPSALRRPMRSRTSKTLRAPVLSGSSKRNGSRATKWFTSRIRVTCRTPLANETGAEPLKGNRDFDKARQLIKESGYKGERIVIIDATDQPIVHPQSLLTLEMLKKLGLNAEVQAGDWGTLITRRTVREPVEKGGWSIFHTWLVGPDMVNPAVNFPLRGVGDKAWFG